MHITESGQKNIKKIYTLLREECDIYLYQQPRHMYIKSSNALLFLSMDNNNECDGTPLLRILRRFS